MSTKPSAMTLFFNSLSRNETATSTIKLESTNGQPVVATSLKYPKAQYLSFKQELEGNDLLFLVVIDGRLVHKMVSSGTDVLTVRTTSENSPEFLFHVLWNIQTAVAAAPNRIAWAEKAGSELEATISLSRKDCKPFRISPQSPEAS